MAAPSPDGRTEVLPGAPEPADPDATRVARPRARTSRPPSAPSTPPSTAGSALPSSATTDAMRSSEALRARGFGLVTAIMSGAALLFLPWLGGASWLRLVMLLALLATFGTSLWFWRRVVHGLYRERDLVLYGAVCVAASVVFCYYLGAFSPTPIATTVGIAFFGLGENRRPATWLPVVATLGWIALTLGILWGVLPDAGVLSVLVATPVERAFFLVMVPLVFGVTLLQARHSRQAMHDAIEESHAALREVLLREAALDEAKGDLDAAMAAGQGLEGRHSGALAGPYRLGEVLGRGAMGEVYAATHEATGERAAVKILHPGLRADTDFVRRFLREGEAAANVAVPEVVRVLATGTTSDDAPYIAMELLSGQDLAWHLRARRKLPPGELLPILGDVARGLEAADRAGIVHRDLKPQNIFCAEQPGARPIWKIVDFGVARHKDGSGTLTRRAVVGTPGYMSPEQAQGQPADHRSDLFALGAVAYRALTGRAPFVGNDLPAMLFDIVYKGPPRPRELEPTLHPDVDLVLAIALAKRPEDRFQHASELPSALEAASAGALPDALRSRGKRLLKALPWGAVLRR